MATKIKKKATGRVVRLKIYDDERLVVAARELKVNITDIVEVGVGKELDTIFKQHPEFNKFFKNN